MRTLHAYDGDRATETLDGTPIRDVAPDCFNLQRGWRGRSGEPTEVCPGCAAEIRRRWPAKSASILAPVPEEL